MKLIEWNELPSSMQKKEVRAYYDVLKTKKTALVIKRLFDFVVSSIMLVFVSPILLILGILIKLDSEGPVFYRQERITTYGKVFRIYKFRTMVVNADKIGALVTSGNDSRITKMGSKIRKYRLDELPQLINIFLGDMSFVGTRPEVKKYVDAYSDEMMATLLLPAGVTSLASIQYKDEDEIISKYTCEGLSVDEVYINKVLPDKMKYNLEYVKEFSFFKDITLMIKTVFAVIK